MTTALGGGKTKAEYKCRSCPRGSESREDALPLSLAGKTGRALRDLLGAKESEPWCPHCLACALEIVHRYQMAHERAK